MRAIDAGWIVPVEGEPIATGRVLVEDGWVRAVGPRDALPATEVRDLGPGVLLPGLVNAHCHLELAHLAGRLDGRDGFVPWVEQVVAARAGEDAAQTSAAARLAVQALEAGGTVAVGDVSNTLVALDALAASSLDAVVFLELIGWDPAAAERVWDGAERRLRAVQPPWNGAGRVPVRRIALAAHAPHSVSPAVFERLRKAGGAAALHLAESASEVEFLRSGGGDWPAFLERRGLGHVPFEAPGLSPVAYAESLGALHPGLVAAHGVQVDEADAGRLARAGVHVVLCPRSNANLRVGTAPVPLLAHAGVRLAVGTDSLASVDSLDVLEDLVALHHTFPEIPARDIVRWGTAGGAAALGLPHLGAIAPGRRAGLAFAASRGPVADPFAHVLSGPTRLVRVAA